MDIKDYKDKKLREAYLKKRLEVNELDEFHNLNELELKGFRPGDTVYIKQKLTYSCTILRFQGKRCVVVIKDKGKKQGKIMKLVFERIHRDPSEIKN